MRRLITGILAALTLAVSSCAWSQPDRYSRVTDRIHSLRHTKRTRVMEIGKSAEGRPIYAIVVADPSSGETALSGRVRVMFICGQHGDESSSVTAMTNLAEELSRAQDPRHISLLGKAMIVIVPVANPDGYARFNRENARGADLNRDWTAVSQPETSSIARLVSQFKPQVIVDEHEWMDGDPSRQTSVEVADFGREHQYKLSRIVSGIVIGRMARKGVRLGTTHYTERANPALAHRRFASLGICSMLIETTPNLSPTARTKIYMSFARELTETLTTPSDARVLQHLSCLPNSSATADPRFASLYVPRDAPQDWTPVLWMMSLAVIALIAGTMGRPMSMRGERHDPLTFPRVRPVVLPVTDILELAASPREKVAILREYRRRPTDRQDPMRKRIVDTPVLLDPSENRMLGRRWDSDVQMRTVSPTPLSEEKKRVARERIAARYLSNPDLRSA